MYLDYKIIEMEPCVPINNIILTFRSLALGLYGKNWALAKVKYSPTINIDPYFPKINLLLLKLIFNEKKNYIDTDSSQWFFQWQ